jgi:hypothetical protein
MLWMRLGFPAARTLSQYFGAAGYWVDRTAWGLIMVPTLIGLLLGAVALWRMAHRPVMLRGVSIAALAICLALSWIILGLFALFFGILFWEGFNPG